MKTLIIAVAASAFSLGAFAASHAEKDADGQAGRLGAGRHDRWLRRPPSRRHGPGRQAAAAKPAASARTKK